jgi:GDP-L-fucose synthase
MNILITGADGLLGSAFKEISGDYPHHTFRFASHKNFDLANTFSTLALLQSGKWDCVVNCAALVGGIKMNKECPADLFYENLMINANVINTAHKIGIEKLFCFSSACAMPDGTYPLTEDILHDGKPFESNYAYGYAKRMVDIQIHAYNEQYKRNYCTMIPVSLYGKGDNFSLDNGHFIPSLINKAFLAKNSGRPLTVWGDGSPLRELIYAEDLARIIVQLAEMDRVPHDKYLVGSGVEVSVKQVAEFIANFMGIKDLVFDTSKANGQLRKPADSSRLRGVVGNFHFTDYESGLTETIIHFCQNYQSARK